MKRVVRKNSETNKYGFSIMLLQDYNNVGIYTPTDGNIGQIDTVCNFVVKTIRTKRYVTIKDGVDLDKYKFVKGVQYTVNWGDGNEETFDIDGQTHSHTYVTNGEYKITMTMVTPWGNHKQVKGVVIPPIDSRDITFDLTMTTPEELGYDDEMLSYVNNTGVIICQDAVSRVKELIKYGETTPTASITDIQGMSGINGISQVTSNTVTYYIDRLKYMDDSQTNMTTISVYPNGFTSGDVIDGVEYINEMLNLYDGPMVHQEVFNGVTGDIDIQSDIFIERGKQAPFEFYYKLGEVSNMKELEQNGNKFFTINNVDDFKL